MITAPRQQTEMDREREREREREKRQTDHLTIKNSGLTLVWKKPSHQEREKNEKHSAIEAVQSESRKIWVKKRYK